MIETKVECILPPAREEYSGKSPRTIGDNGPQVRSRVFLQFIGLTGTTHA